MSVARVGVDLSKRVFQVHAVDRQGRMVVSKAITSSAFFIWCALLSGARLVAMEACWDVHHVARSLLVADVQSVPHGEHLRSVRSVSRENPAQQERPPPPLTRWGLPADSTAQVVPAQSTLLTQTSRQELSC